MYFLSLHRRDNKNNFSKTKNLLSTFWLHAAIWQQPTEKDQKFCFSSLAILMHYLVLFRLLMSNYDDKIVQDTKGNERKI